MSQFTKWAQTERSTGVQVAALAAAGVVLLGLIPYVIIVLSPRLDRLMYIDVVEPGPLTLAVGTVLLVAGMAFGLWSVYLEMTRGRGTPLPMLPTHELLTTGPYRYCRNPMTLGTIAAYLGMSVAAATVIGTALVLTIGGLLVLYLKRVEEKELAERFGEEYVTYAREVPFIIPRIPRT